MKSALKTSHYLPPQQFCMTLTLLLLLHTSQPSSRWQGAAHSEMPSKNIWRQVYNPSILQSQLKSKMIMSHLLFIFYIIIDGYNGHSDACYFIRMGKSNPKLSCLSATVSFCGFSGVVVVVVVVILIISKNIEILVLDPFRKLRTVYFNENIFSIWKGDQMLVSEDQSPTMIYFRILVIFIPGDQYSSF